MNGDENILNKRSMLMNKRPHQEPKVSTKFTSHIADKKNVV